METKLICPHCGSDKIEAKAWVQLNRPAAPYELIDASEPEFYYCVDCGESGIPIEEEGSYIQPKAIDLPQIQQEYLDGDVCMFDLLGVLPADGLTIKQAFELYIEAKRWADGDVTIDDVTIEL